MESFIIHPQDQEQARRVKAFLKDLKIPFESIEKSPYDPEFVTRITESQQQLKEGKGTRISSGDDLKEFLGIDDQAL